MYTKVIPQRISLPIGSEVQILSLAWYILNVNIATGIIDIGLGFTVDMSKYCKKITKIVEYDEFTHTYGLSIDGGKNRWSEEMFKKK